MCLAQRFSIDNFHREDIACLIQYPLPEFLSTYLFKLATFQSIMLQLPKSDLNMHVFNVKILDVIV